MMTYRRWFKGAILVCEDHVRLTDQAARVIRLPLVPCPGFKAKPFMPVRTRVTEYHCYRVDCARLYNTLETPGLLSAGASRAGPLGPTK